MLIENNSFSAVNLYIGFSMHEYFINIYNVRYVDACIPQILYLECLRVLPTIQQYFTHIVSVKGL